MILAVWTHGSAVFPVLKWPSSRRISPLVPWQHSVGLRIVANSLCFTCVGTRGASSGDGSILRGVRDIAVRLPICQLPPGRMTDPESGSSLRYLAHSTPAIRRYIALTARQNDLICSHELIITEEPSAAPNGGYSRAPRHGGSRGAARSQPGR